MNRRRITVVSAHEDGSHKVEIQLNNVLIQNSGDLILKKIELTLSGMPYAKAMDSIGKSLKTLPARQRKIIAELMMNIIDITGNASDLDDSLSNTITELDRVKANLKRKLAVLESKLPSLDSVSARFETISKSGKASEFLNENWAPYIEAGLCYRSDIKRVDRKLEMALRNEFRGRPEQLRAILPNKADEVTARLNDAAAAAVQSPERGPAVQTTHNRRTHKPN